MLVCQYFSNVWFGACVYFLMSVALTFCKSQRGFPKSPAELQEKVGASVGDDTTIGPPHISRELFFVLDSYVRFQNATPEFDFLHGFDLLFV